MVIRSDDLFANNGEFPCFILPPLPALSSLPYLPFPHFPSPSYWHGERCELHRGGPGEVRRQMLHGALAGNYYAFGDTNSTKCVTNRSH